jgi:NAD(P)-dependent dehydrogenase (short-subunit alcohol dehydrogenase family)
MNLPEEHHAVSDVSERTIAELISLKGRRAVVTGAAQGIGFAIAKRLAEAGAAVIIGDLNAVAAREAAQLLTEQQHAAASGYGLDVTDSASIAALADRAVQEMGGLDIWVNNAGIYPSAPLLEMTDEQWDMVLGVNLRGTLVGAREAARRMVANRAGGVIINLASIAAYKATSPGEAHYVTSKHGVRGLTKSLAVELGPYGIRVLALAPTLIETPGISTALQQLMPVPQEAEFIKQRAARLPLRRIGVPDDVARVALFCASDLSMLMTGSTLLVDAGDLLL